MILKKLNRLIFILTVGLILNSCGGFGFLYQKHLTENIWLIAIDEIEQMSISIKDSENGHSGLLGSAALFQNFIASFCFNVFKL